MRRAGLGSVAQLGALAGLLGLGGCYVTERYLVTPEQLAQAAQILPAEAANTALPVRRYVIPAPGREPSGKPVFVRAEDVQHGLAELGTPPSVLIVRRYSPAVTAGVALTVIGSLISVAGSIVFFSSFNTAGDLHTISGVIALSAEPMMLAGTLLWIMGIQRPAQEVSAGRPGVHYLELVSPVPAPTQLPTPAPALSLRF